MTDRIPGPADPQPTQKSIAERAIALRNNMTEREEQEEFDRLNKQKTELLQEKAERYPQATNGQTPVRAAIPRLTQAIAAVMSEIGVIKKSGTNRFHNYSYSTPSDVSSALTPLMGKHGIVILQDEAEITTFENRVAVKYEFTVSHVSGEMWGPMRRTGTAMARDTKGGFDDKALNKAQTQAMKNFCIKLFQIPADETDGDGDEDQGPSNANQRPKSSPVPGPSSAPPPKAAPLPPKVIPARGKSPDAWTREFIQALGAAASQQEVTELIAANNDVLERIYAKYPSVGETLNAAIEQRSGDLSEPGIPSDAQERMNWIAEQLGKMVTLAAAEAFWNTYVAPLEKEFEIEDWEMLLSEFERTTARLNPQEDTL